MILFLHDTLQIKIGMAVVFCTKFGLHQKNSNFDEDLCIVFTLYKLYCTLIDVTNAGIRSVVYSY